MPDGRIIYIGGEAYLVGDARALPFPGAYFNLCVAETSLCFIDEQEQAIGEMLRLLLEHGHGRMALGLLNRHSALYRQTGCGGGRGAYRGAHWHTPAELRGLDAAQRAADLQIRSAIFPPDGKSIARALERFLPGRLLLGGFLAVAMCTLG